MEVKVDFSRRIAHRGQLLSVSGAKNQLHSIYRHDVTALLRLNDNCVFFSNPLPLGEGGATAPGEGHRSSATLRPSPFLKASPCRARASRPLPEGEDEFSGIKIHSYLL
jgi:hypothetical protein